MVGQLNKGGGGNLKMRCKSGPSERGKTFKTKENNKMNIIIKVPAKNYREKEKGAQIFQEQAPNTTDRLLCNL